MSELQVTSSFYRRTLRRGQLFSLGYLLKIKSLDSKISLGGKTWNLLQGGKLCHWSTLEQLFQSWFLKQLQECCQGHWCLQMLAEYLQVIIRSRMVSGMTVTFRKAASGTWEHEWGSAQLVVQKQGGAQCPHFLCSLRLPRTRGWPRNREFPPHPFFCSAGS